MRLAFGLYASGTVLLSCGAIASAITAADDGIHPLAWALTLVVVFLVCATAGARAVRRLSPEAVGAGTSPASAASEWRSLLVAILGLGAMLIIGSLTFLDGTMAGLLGAAWIGGGLASGLSAFSVSRWESHTGLKAWLPGDGGLLRHPPVISRTKGGH